MFMNILTNAVSEK